MGNLGEMGAGCFLWRGKEGIWQGMEQDISSEAMVLQNSFALKDHKVRTQSDRSLDEGTAIYDSYTSYPTRNIRRIISRDDLSAKFWLEPVGLARNLGFTPKELRRIQKLVVEHQAVSLEAWHGHFGTDG